MQSLVARDLLHQGTVARHDDPAAAGALVRRAVTAARDGLQAWADVARDESDATSVAAYHHFLVRQVEEKATHVFGDGVR